MNIFEKADRLINAVGAVLNLDAHLWDDIGPHLACSEADAFAELLAAGRDDQLAHRLLKSHAASDDEGDDHFYYGKET